MNKKIISLLLGIFFVAIGTRINAMDPELSTMIEKYHNKPGVEVYSMFNEALNPEGNRVYLKSLYSILNANKNPNENNQVSWKGLETLYIQLFNLFKPTEEKDTSKEQKKKEEPKKVIQIKKYVIVPHALELGLGAASIFALGFMSNWLMHSFFNTK